MGEFIPLLSWVIFYEKGKFKCTTLLLSHNCLYLSCVCIAEFVSLCLRVCVRVRVCWGINICVCVSGNECLKVMSYCTCAYSKESVDHLYSLMITWVSHAALFLNPLPWQWCLGFHQGIMGLRQEDTRWVYPLFKSQSRFSRSVQCPSLPPGDALSDSLYLVWQGPHLS